MRWSSPRLMMASYLQAVEGMSYGTRLIEVLPQLGTSAILEQLVEENERNEGHLVLSRGPQRLCEGEYTHRL